VLHASRICLLLGFVLACSNTVTLRYSPGGETAKAGGPGLIYVRGFADVRKKGASDLGVVRGGFGNILKRIYTDRPVSAQVTDAFRAALSSRSLLAEPEDAEIALEGTVTKLDCNHFYRREAHTSVRVVLVDLASEKPIFARIYAADETSATLATGILSSTSRLAGMAERTLQKTIDQVLADPEFLSIATTTPGSIEPTGPTREPLRDRTTEDRLLELQRLLEGNLISPEEYEAKRQQILNDL